MPRTTGSSSSSTAAGVPRSTRSSCSDEAVSKYGSEAEAARWVATPDTSAHVSGDAVDIGPSDATAWLSEHGAEYGLCQIYGNEPWHYELRPEAVDHGCPPMYADPTHDPRMQRRDRPSDPAHLRPGTGSRRPMTTPTQQADRESHGEAEEPDEGAAGRALRRLPRAARLDRAVEARSPVGGRRVSGRQARPVRSHPAAPRVPAHPARSSRTSHCSFPLVSTSVCSRTERRGGGPQ